MVLACSDQAPLVVVSESMQRLNLGIKGFRLLGVEVIKGLRVLGVEGINGFRVLGVEGIKGVQGVRG